MELLRPPLKIRISSQYFVAHKKCFLTYHPYAASTFFVPALSCLELRIIRGALQSFARHMGIDLRGGNVGMARQQLHHAQVSAVIEQVGSKSVV